MKTHLWLRAESKTAEKRTPLVPEDAAKLVAAGFNLTVEDSSQRVIPLERFLAVGCHTAAAGAWQDAPEEAFILGLKELPEAVSELHHRHIYFAHAYKEQQGWQNLLQRFVRGNGALYDIEYLLDANQRRVAAFGYWAGYAGIAVAIKAWCGQQLGNQPVLPPIQAYANQDSLLQDLHQALEQASLVAGHKPTGILIGAKGRVGNGALNLAQALDIPYTAWDLEETARGGPFAEILEHDLFINCVLLQSALPPFITRESLADTRKLSVIADVSCDPFSPYNPLPLYNQCTSFASPTLRLLQQPPLDLIAIDHLPSMLPLESSTEFSAQLLPHLYNLVDAQNPVWHNALAIFQQKIQNL